MWLLLAFISAILLGFYDVSKKKSVQNNAVIPVLFFSILFSSIIFTPLVLLSTYKPDVLAGTVFQASVEGWEVHKYIILKSIIVLSSWIFGYYGLKHLPITIVGPINATRPVLVLVGAIFIFGERLNTLQWIGVLLAILSFFMLSRSGKKEGIHFRNNKWIAFVVIATVLGAIGGLYDKFLMTNFNTVTVQAWYNYYQLLLLLPILAFIWWPTRHQTTPFSWKWSILAISLFLSAADFIYFYALSIEGALVAVISMVRRGSVVVSFLFGALLFKEKNLKSKALDLLLVIIGLFFLYIGSK